MKKIFLLAVAACFMGSATTAQDVFKQTGGEKSVEALFAPFGGTPITINGIRVRSFTSATTALRAEVFLGFASNTDILGTVQNGDEIKRNTNSFDIEINPGIEFHLPGTDRLSPYYGGFVQIGYNRESSREDLTGVNAEFQTILDGERTERTSFFRFGAYAVGGFDYYFSHNIYLGAEIGFGLGATLLGDRVTEAPANDGDGVTTTETPRGSSFDLGPGAVGRLRLGILF
jgi:opacity protein-like surface antigen